MRLTPVQYAVRLAWGVGLLFMPAVQEKLCAVTPPPPAEPPSPLAQPKAPGDSTSKKDKQPFTLAALAPDVVPPRLAEHYRIASAARARSLPAATSLARDRDDSHHSNVVGGVLSPFLNLTSQLPESDPAPAIAAAADGVATSHVFESCILETGPPAERTPA